MKLYNSISAIAAALLLLPGCNKEPGPADSGCITIEAAVGPMTKMDYDGDKTTFTAGDQIALYAWTGSSSPVPTERVVDGVVNTLGGDGKWTPASLMRWKTMTDKHYFLGVSPAREDITDFTADPYTLDPANFAASDLLIATNLDGLTPSSAPVALSFRHAMAKLNINLTFRSQWSVTPEVSAVTVTARSNAKINYLTSVVTATDAASAVPVPALETAASGYDRSFSGLQVPQLGAQKVTVTIAGTDYVYDAGVDIPLESGQITTLNLNVGRDRIELGSMCITNWAAGTSYANQEVVQPVVPFQIGTVFPEATFPFRNGWQNGDAVFVLFDNVPAPKYLRMSFDGTAWTYTEMNGAAASPGCLGLKEGDSGSMRAFYLPFGNDAVLSASGTDFRFGTAPYDCYFTASLPYSVSGGTIRGTFELTLPDGAYLFFIDDPGVTYFPYSYTELREPNLTPLGLASVSADLGTVSGAPAHGAPMKGRLCNASKKGYAFYGTLASCASGVRTDYHYTYVVYDWPNSTYAGLTIPGRTLSGDGPLTRVETLHRSDSGWIVMNDYQPVDLGLEIPTGVGTEKKRVYWSTNNVGISTISPRGISYAWAEVMTKSVFTQASYKWTPDNGIDSYFNLSKYTFDDGQTDATWYSPGGVFIGDGKTSLADYDYADDVARFVLGGAWRTPTEAEWSALLDTDKFTWTWEETEIFLTPMQGMRVTSKIPGFEGRSIFLPAAGYRLSVEFSGRDEWGYYWTSCLYTPSMDARTLVFNNTTGAVLSHIQRFYGYSVRPVTD